MKILYVEDDPNAAQLVSLYVRSTEHDLEVAPTIEMAQAALDSDTALIMVDLMFGSARQGVSFGRDVRNQGYNRSMVAVTALSTERDLEDCREAGFDDVLIKPFTIT